MEYIFDFLHILFLEAIELSPIPLTMQVNTEKAELGKKLFVDPILSKDKTLSCLSCHNLI